MMKKQCVYMMKVGSTTGYYVDDNGNGGYKLLYVVRTYYSFSEGVTKEDYFYGKNVAIKHMDYALSKVALETRMRRICTYSIHRVLLASIQDRLNKIETELLLNAL